jgi:hypothetical protein
VDSLTLLRALFIKPAARGVLKAARPAWKRAQARLRSAMTGEQWNQMWQVFRVFTNASNHALSNKGVN